MNKKVSISLVFLVIMVVLVNLTLSNLAVLSGQAFATGGGHYSYDHDSDDEKDYSHKDNDHDDEDNDKDYGKKDKDHDYDKDDDDDKPKHSYTPKPSKSPSPSPTPKPSKSPTPTPTPSITPTPSSTPQFPLCPLNYDGDVASYNEGWHQIPGGNLLYGSDDVYSLAGGNYIQCFCPEEGNGIQTNWWRSDSQKEGWMSYNGSQWNLGNFNYLAKNSEFYCDTPTQTPTPTPTPNPTPTPVPSSTPTPTPSISPTPTPTPSSTPTPSPTPTPTPPLTVCLSNCGGGGGGGGPITTLEIDKLGRDITKGETVANTTSLATAPGHMVEFTIKVKSTTSSTVYRVLIFDFMPNEFSYISGSTTVNGVKTGDGIITSAGLNIGDLNPNQEVTIKFLANVAGQTAFTSGVHNRENRARVTSITGGDNEDRLPIIIPMISGTSTIGQVAPVSTGGDTLALSMLIALVAVNLYMVYGYTSFGQRQIIGAISLKHRLNKDKFNFAREI